MYVLASAPRPVQSGFAARAGMPSRASVFSASPKLPPRPSLIIGQTESQRYLDAGPQSIDFSRTLDEANRSRPSRTKIRDLDQTQSPFDQTEEILRIATRGPGFALDETLCLDGRTDPSNQQLFGATALKTRTAWFEDHKQLVPTHQIKTKQGKKGRTDHHKIPDKRREKHGSCIHPKAQRRTKQYLWPPNLEQASVSTGSRIASN
jgi:hypothetical protein